ncbi:hypothetical protein [Micromonospora avicenniae]|uniref:hypothetical protein n=1 Tax=Micromonospora avicenniae TaxID=1198245 RepID=UPI00332FB179
MNITIIGITDEQTTCDLCGRTELRSTVILGDEDRTEIGRYGSVCAGRVLSENQGRKVTGVLDMARKAEMVRRSYVMDAFGRVIRHLKAGDVAKANWERAQGKRWHGYIRPDEIALDAKVLEYVKARHREATALNWVDWYAANK